MVNEKVLAKLKISFLLRELAVVLETCQGEIVN